MGRRGPRRRRGRRRERPRRRDARRRSVLRRRPGRRGRRGFLEPLDRRGDRGERTPPPARSPCSPASFPRPNTAEVRPRATRPAPSRPAPRRKRRSKTTPPCRARARVCENASSARANSASDSPNFPPAGSTLIESSRATRRRGTSSRRTNSCRARPPPSRASPGRSSSPNDTCVSSRSRRAATVRTREERRPSRRLVLAHDEILGVTRSKTEGWIRVEVEVKTPEVEVSHSRGGEGEAGGERGERVSVRKSATFSGFGGDAETEGALALLEHLASSE